MEETKALQIFKFEGTTEIRTIVDQDGKIWFVAKDICKALDIVNTSDAILTLKENYQLIGVDIDAIVSNYSVADTLGRMQEMTTVTEVGLYDLGMQSRKPSALKFKHWISSKVLPAIRKTGSYSISPKSYKEALLEIVKQIEEKERIEAEKIELLEHVDDLKEEVEELKEDIGVATNWKQVRAIQWIPNIFDIKLKGTWNMIGKALTKMSREMKIEKRYAEDTRHGEVGVYHRCFSLSPSQR